MKNKYGLGQILNNPITNGIIFIVKTIVDGLMTEGRKEVGWEAKDNGGRTVASGVYFYRLIVGDFVQTKKMVLLR